MNSKGIKKHLEVLNWFYAEEGRTVSIRPSGQTMWSITYTPLWNEDYEYVPNDIYVDIRKASVEGKQIEYRCFHRQDKAWEDTTCEPYGKSFHPHNEYRVKEEVPPFKIGDYVYVKGCIHPRYVNLVGDKTLHCYGPDSQLSSVISYIKNLGDVELWTIEDADPSEVVLIWHTDSNLPELTTARRYNNGGTWDNVVPYIGQDLKLLGMKNYRGVE